jgi:hypothetical protein
MRQISTAAGVSLAYETIGSAADPAVLFVMGFGTQLIGWPLGSASEWPTAVGS